MPRQVSERAIVTLVGAIQFVNILDFMMVMPLGPDFSSSLGIPASHLGYIGGSYTAAAAVSGLAGAFFLDRFDRRPALAVAMLGLVLGTAAGALATGLASLLAARVLAGLFGGPATSLSLSIIADVVPPERRGKAMGAVMGSFAIASVLGVPAGLELARLGGWRTPFLAVAALGAVITAGALLLLPPMRAHLARDPHDHPSIASLFSRPVVLLSYAMTAALMAGAFILIPNISAYTQFNLHYPRSRLGLLYLVGGVVSFFALRVVGRLVDRYGSFRTGLAGAVMMASVIYVGFVVYPTPIPVVVLFVGFMLANSFRNVPYNALASRVPSPAERARFMSIQSAVQHLASALGAFASARMLSELPDHTLVGMPRVAAVSIAMALTVPALIAMVESRVKRRDAAALAAGAPGKPVL